MDGGTILILIVLGIAAWMLITQAIVVIAPYIAGGVIILAVGAFVWFASRTQRNEQNEEGPE